MGLNCTHGAFDGAYSSFNRLRVFVLKAIGGSWPPHENKVKYPDDRMVYVDDEELWEKKEGLREFLCHSDCDGIITAEMCKKVADELEEFLPKFQELEKTEFATGHLQRHGYVGKIKIFIEGCRLANSLGEDLEFM